MGFCVTFEFGSLFQIAMSSALKAFTHGMFTFAEIIIVAGVVSSLAAIALLSSLGLEAFPGWERRFDNLSNLELPEIALVLVRLNHVASFIVNADYSGDFGS
jgi:hypothetical protein